MQEYLSFFVHNNGFLGFVWLKCHAFASHRNLKCSAPVSVNYCGWEECMKIALCFKCIKKTLQIINNKVNQKEKNKEVAGTSDDVTLVIHCA